MNTRVKLRFATAVGLLLLMACAACTSPTVVSESAAAAPERPEPEEAIADFYAWYTHYPGNPLVDGALSTSPMVTAGLVENVETILRSFDGRGGYDPVLCAQDIPNTFIVEVTDRSVDSASAVVRTEFESHEIYVGAVNVDGEWRIADVTCPADRTAAAPHGGSVTAATPTPWPAVGTSASSTVSAAAEEPQTDRSAEWLLFQDAEHGFQIAHPADWRAMDLPLYDPGVSGPPTVVRRLVVLYPADWEERFNQERPPDPNAPGYPALSIEVCAGTMEAFRREFIELGASEPIDIDGAQGTCERDAQDDHNLIRYVFQHPEEELIIGVTDPVNGFSARVAESGAVPDLIPQIVETFSFVD